MTQQAFIFIGRYGSGKGTQADLLMKYLRERDQEHPVLYMYTGNEFRKFMNEGKTYTARLSREVVEKGILMPEFMASYIWEKMLVDYYTGKEHIIFDGSPRKLLEAQMMESVFPFYGLGKPHVIYLDVEHDESHKRLTLRAQSSGRVDDSQRAIETRKQEYEQHVLPVIEFYKTTPNAIFLDIDGEQTIEKVHEDIVKALGF